MNKTDYLNTIIGKSLCYAVKSPDIELYDFGFGEAGNKCSHILHVICDFKIMHKNGEQKTNLYSGDTSSEIFSKDIKNLTGLQVKRAQLSDKNDLWLDFGDYWVVFVTCEDGNESWRLFAPNKEIPHMVVSDSKIEFV